MAFKGGGAITPIGGGGMLTAPAASLRSSDIDIIGGGGTESTAPIVSLLSFCSRLFGAPIVSLRSSLFCMAGGGIIIGGGATIGGDATIDGGATIGGGATIDGGSKGAKAPAASLLSSF